MTLAIVGTGTDVGKTVVAAVVLARYGGEMPLAYWKPVATGARDGRDSATVAALAGDRAAILPETCLFPEPLSPHLAARLAGCRIDPATLLADFDRHRAADRGRGLVIETAGGLFVPLVEPDGVRREKAGDLPGSTSARARASAGRGLRGGRILLSPGGETIGTEVPSVHGDPSAAAGGYLQADLLADMARRAGPGGLACLVVGRSGLGTINHTLLTLEALRARRLAVAGVVLDGPPNRENRLAVERFGGVEAIWELPPLAPLDRAAVAAAAGGFDPEGRLGPLLRTAGPRTHPSNRPPRLPRPTAAAATAGIGHRSQRARNGRHER